MNNLFIKPIDQYIQDKIQVFHIWHNLSSELTSILAIQKQPMNRPQFNKSDRPTGDYLGHLEALLKYLNINFLGTPKIPC